MLTHASLTDAEVRALIRKGQIAFAGNGKLKIYGLLKCSSGKRMKRQNRMFFATEQEASEAGYRPCSHCMRETYRKWKNGFI
jgi:methylphosphotriester-DNA--protein-cysteine methyltransferase